MVLMDRGAHGELWRDLEELRPGAGVMVPAFTACLSHAPAWSSWLLFPTVSQWLQGGREVPW